MWYCSSCFALLETRHRGLHACNFCLDELSEYELHGARPALFSPTGIVTDVTSLWRYRGVIREIIIRAKVRGEIPALDLLSNWVLERAETTPLVQWSDVIVPAPASLWGRVRGRLDIAGNLAAALAREHQKKICRAPIDLMWRWHKNALRKRRSRQHGDPVEAFATKIIKMIRQIPRCHNFGFRSYPPRILLLDDVMTSGTTLQRTAALIAKESGHIIRCLTIARS